MLLRFVVGQLAPDLGGRQGLFQAAFALKQMGTLPAIDHDTLRRCLAWFGRSPQSQTRLELSNCPDRQPQAICWLKDSAVTHNAKIREYGLVLERNGLLVEELRTTRPGYTFTRTGTGLRPIPSPTP